MSILADVEAGRLANIVARLPGQQHGNSVLGDNANPLKPATSQLHDLYVGMNKTEQRRGEELEGMKRRGEIAAWWYERVTLKLAYDCRYTPDFMVQEMDGSLRFEETKGFMRDDAAVKLKVCGEQFPFPLWLLVPQKRGGGWKITVVK